MSNINNGNILNVYLAENCNPNGNPSEDNMPRISFDNRIEVTDLRLKRDVRDYFISNGKEIYVSKLLDGKSSLDKGAKHIMADKRIETSDHLSEFVDVRLFGGVFPKSKDNRHLTGPIQFGFGYSFEKDVDIIETQIITTFKTSEDNDGSVGSMGKDYRVSSATIGFHGTISAENAKHTSMTIDDLDSFDEAMEYSLIMNKSRSKMGRYPLIYMRLEYNDDKMFFSRNLTSFISQKDGSQDYSGLIEYLTKIENKIKTVYLVYDETYFNEYIEHLGNVFGERLKAKEFFADKVK